MNEKESKINFNPDLSLEEALSHRSRSRLFEIMGYLDIIDKSRLTPEDQIYFLRVEELCKTLINEIQKIIDQYRNS